MFDQLNEIFATISRNKMRTFLTGFSVAWGIFMLIVLLGAGNGLRNGVMSNFAGRAMNSVSLRPGWTSMPYKGLNADRRILFDQRTVEFVRRAIPEVGYLSASIFHTNLSVAYGEEYGTWQTEACMPELDHIDYMIMRKGRFLNDIDQQQRRKVIVISTAAEKVLFKGGEEPIGKYIIADGIAFQVVGVYDTPLAQNYNPPIYIPLSTGLMLYDRGWGIRTIEFTANGIDDVEQAEALTERIRGLLGLYLGFDPADRSALNVWNNAEQAAQTNNIFVFLNIFLVVVGLASLMAGIVGVGNIMLITVKERTREIGIRKALGATPWSVIKMIIFEAIFITTAAGYVGIVLGIGLIEVVNKVLSSAGSMSEGDAGTMTMFQNPSVSMGVVLGATLLLVACGVVAGLIPSLKATRIRPIEAMRAD
ncbi:MAG: ABC transporter permease [Rikenellaceae bacterium]|jgi:putative ABC transport system permease protein|nr:ABC transporter permease [Rikenellaceae bacterium]